MSILQIISIDRLLDNIELMFYYIVRNVHFREFPDLENCLQPCLQVP